jgi:hypothetical protein
LIRLAPANNTAAQILLTHVVSHKTATSAACAPMQRKRVSTLTEFLLACVVVNLSTNPSFALLSPFLLQSPSHFLPSLPFNTSNHLPPTVLFSIPSICRAYLLPGCLLWTSFCRSLALRLDADVWADSALSRAASPPAANATPP